VVWFDTGRLGFVWHVVNGWELETEGGNPTEESRTETEEDQGKIVLFLNVFDYYPETVPIHVAEEPPSHLWRYEIDPASGSVTGEKVLDSVATERNDCNRLKTGLPTKYAYLMKRGEGREMYDGFIKFDLESSKVVAVVNYGAERFGGEALFVPKAIVEKDDDGYLMDIVYDGNTGGSELCIWDAASLTGNAANSPIGRIHLPHRVPYGVHANWLTTEEVYRQRDWFKHDAKPE